MQILNTIINGGRRHSAKAEKPMVKPPSLIFEIKKVQVYNHRNESIEWWWVNDGKPVLYAVIPGRVILQVAFAPEPWLVTDANGQLLTAVTLYKSNMELTIE